MRQIFVVDDVRITVDQQPAKVADVHSPVSEYFGRAQIAATNPFINHFSLRTTSFDREMPQEVDQKLQP
jgi:hypothetical protein